MNQIDLIDAAKQQQGLTSDNQLALSLDITPSRLCALRKMRRNATPEETLKLAKAAKINFELATAVIQKDAEKAPAKRAYWEKIAMQFSMAILMISVCLLTIFPKHAEAKAQVDNLQIMRNSNALAQNKPKPFSFKPSAPYYPLLPSAGSCAAVPPGRAPNKPANKTANAGASCR